MGTRNIIGGHGIPQFFVDWFCGGLQYQVDHHLFPMMPRNNIAKCHKLVESFCKEWDVDYHAVDMWVGTLEVLNHLQNVSDEFLVEMVEDFPAMYLVGLFSWPNKKTDFPFQGTNSH